MSDSYVLLSHQLPLTIPFCLSYSAIQTIFIPSLDHPACPHNPSVSVTNSHNLYFVSDEIYAGTVFAAPGFVSVAEILEAEKHLNRYLIHIVYSLSKDMGFPGFRVGIIYSYNDAVVGCARKMSSFGLVSSQTQQLLALMLSDHDFVDRFLAESSELSVLDGLCDFNSFVTRNHPGSWHSNDDPGETLSFTSFMINLHSNISESNVGSLSKCRKSIQQNNPALLFKHLMFSYSSPPVKNLWRLPNLSELSAKNLSTKKSMPIQKPIF